MVGHLYILDFLPKIDRKIEKLKQVTSMKMTGQEQETLLKLIGYRRAVTDILNRKVDWEWRFKQF